MWRNIELLLRGTLKCVTFIYTHLRAYLHIYIHTQIHTWVFRKVLNYALERLKLRSFKYTIHQDFLSKHNRCRYTHLRIQTFGNCVCVFAIFDNIFKKLFCFLSGNLHFVLWRTWWPFWVITHYSLLNYIISRSRGRLLHSALSNRCQYSLTRKKISHDFINNIH